MPFAAGQHLCIGNDFAMVEMAVTLALIAQRYKLALADDAPVGRAPDHTGPRSGDLDSAGASMISILDTRDPDAVRAYERAFYSAFRRATANRLVRKLWLWNDAEGRVATRIPYSDQRIYTLVGPSGAIHAALAANLAMREFQSAAFGFTPAERDGAVEVLTFFSTSSDVGGTTRLFRGFVEDIHGDGRHTAFATTAERPFVSTAASARNSWPSGRSNPSAATSSASTSVAADGTPGESEPNCARVRSGRGGQQC